MIETKNLSRRDVLKLGGPLATAAVLGCGALGAEPGATAKPAGGAIEPDGIVHGRLIPQGSLPFVDCKGTAMECGRMLGSIWKEPIAREAARAQATKPWWKSPRYRPLLEKYAPHLPDVYRGMARGAGVSEDAVGERAPKDDATAGCTSFALAPEATLEGIPISGQNKDVSVARGRQLLVLRMKMTDAPSVLTLTYAGSIWLFGHGFVQGGTAIFRNSIYIEKGAEGLPYFVWGLIALHCPTVEEVMELTSRYRVAEAFHVVVADCRGRIVGIEGGRGGVAYLRPKDGVYAHANAVLSEGPLRDTEKDAGLFRRAESLHRTQRLTERLQAERGRLTAQLAYNALCDHDGYPTSVCRHQSQAAHTAAAVIAEPTRGLLHITRGAPCQNWPRTYSIA
jgi:isopenicillin-N N-acyltransferase like protein